MNRRWIVGATMTVAILCTSCSQRAWIAQLVPPDADHFARGVVDSLRS